MVIGGNRSSSGDLLVYRVIREREPDVTEDLSIVCTCE